MNKVEDFINATKLNDLLNKKEDLINMTKLNELLNKKEAEEKRTSKVVWIFAIIGIIAAVAAAVYGVYRFFTLGHFRRKTATGSFIGTLLRKDLRRAAENDRPPHSILSAA